MSTETKGKKLGLWNWPAHWDKETAGSLHPGHGHIPAILDISMTAPWPTPGPTGQLPGAAGHFLLRYGLAQGLGPFSLWVKEPAEAETFISSLLRKEHVSRRWFCFALFCLVMGSGCLVTWQEENVAAGNLDFVNNRNACAWEADFLHGLKTKSRGTHSSLGMCYFCWKHFEKFFFCSL